MPEFAKNILSRMETLAAMAGNIPNAEDTVAGRPSGKISVSGKLDISDVSNASNRSF